MGRQHRNEVSAGVGTERFELLAALGGAADGTLSLGDTVERLLMLVVPAFADLATLDAVAPGGDLQRIGARVAARGSVERDDDALRSANPPACVAAAIATRRTVMLAASGEGRSPSPADRRALASLGLRALLVVPLRARGRILGALACGRAASGRDFTDGELSFAEVMASRIALALDHAGLSQEVSGLQRRLEATLANLAEAVVVRNADGRIVFANPATARLLRVGSVRDVTSAPPGSLMALYDVFDVHGNPVDMADLPSGRAWRGEWPEPMLVRNVIRATGEERWLLSKATPVYDDAGELSLIVSVIEDVTDVKRAELSQRLLAEAGKELSSSLDYTQTLQRVARLAVPELADWCGVMMRGDGDSLQQVAVAHIDPDKVALVREFGERYPPRLSDRGGAAEAIRSGEAQLVPAITDEVIAAAGLSRDQLALLRDLQMRSVIVVPLTIAGRPPIGVLSLVMAESGRTFDAHDLGLAQELGRRAATAVENARLYTERSRIAATLQRSLLPPELPHVPGFRLAGLYRAAGEQNEVGGDFYDAFEVPGGWMIIVGDVAGRGADAAALTSLSRYTLRTAGRLLGDPVGAVTQLNAALRERAQFSLVTACCALVRTTADEVAVDVVLAGHPPAYHVHDRTPRPVGALAPLLGVYDTGGWEATAVTLSPGDQLVLYTDGVIDTVGAAGRFGERRLADALRGAASADDSVRRVDDALQRFASGPQVDDTAVLVIERSPDGSPPA